MMGSALPSLFLPQLLPSWCPTASRQFTWMSLTDITRFSQRAYVAQCVCIGEITFGCNYVLPSTWFLSPDIVLMTCSQSAEDTLLIMDIYSICKASLCQSCVPKQGVMHFLYICWICHPDRNRSWWPGSDHWKESSHWVELEMRHFLYVRDAALINGSIEFSLEVSSQGCFMENDCPSHDE